MCIHKHIKKRFPINSYWHWGYRERSVLLCTVIIIRIINNEIIEYDGVPCIQGNIVLRRNNIVQNDNDYDVAIRTLHPLTKEERQRWTSCSLGQS